MFENLSERIQGVFKKLSGQARINETVLKQALREVRLALLEADVHVDVVKALIGAVRDKALLGKLAMVLQQMDSSVFASHDAVQEVSKILNAYASADMRDLALMLSSTLTNHLKPHVGGLTAQAMANIVLRVGVA